MKDLFGNTVVSLKEARGLDKFYTKEVVVKQCLSKINFKDYDLVIEPSAGNGSFSKKIHHINLVALDLYPESKKIKKQN